MELELPFEFYLKGVPISLQGSRNSIDKWKQRVADAAEEALPNQIYLTEDPLGLEILLFFDDEDTLDIDNAVKPIQDALCKVIYMDDKQIIDLRVSKFTPNRVARFKNPTQVLAAAMDEQKPLVYIRVHKDDLNA